MSTKTQLRNAIKEMIDVLELTETNKKGKKGPIVVDEDATEKDIVTLIKDAIPLIEPTDKLSVATLQVIEEFSEETPEEENKGLEDAPSTLEDEISNADTVKELKDIALSEPQFKSIRSKLASFKDVDALREEMLWLFTGAKVPKEVKEQKLPLEETQQEIAERLSKKIEDAPVNAKKAKNYTKEEIEELPDEKNLIGKGIMRTKDILTIKPFNGLFDIDEKILDSVKENMKAFGYDLGFPIILWEDVVVDGHTRLIAAEELGIKEVPVFQKEFKNEREALEYAIHNQRDRRNLSDAELLRCIEAIDKPMSKKEAGKKGGASKSEIVEPVKSHKETAKKLGVGETKITDARTVLADKEARKDVESGKKSITKAAREVREKKTVSKPKKAKIEKKTRIQAICDVLKANADGEMKIAEILEEADMAFEDGGGKSDMKATEKTFDIVLEVLVAIGFITNLDGVNIKIEEL